MAQTYTEFEAVLVDDGSTDSSGRICDEYAQKDARFVTIHKRNEGASCARNYGIELARGNWISFVDADDWVESDYLESFLLLEEKGDINYFSLTRHYNSGFEQTTLLPSLHICEKKTIDNFVYQMKYCLGVDVFGWTWVKFYRASIIKDNNIRFTADVVFREDEIFTMHFFKYTKSLATISKSLYHYRILDSGLTYSGIRTSDYLPLATHIEELYRSFLLPELRNRDYNRVVFYRVKDILTCKKSLIFRRLRQLKKSLKDNSEIEIKNKRNHLLIPTIAKKSCVISYIYVLLIRLIRS